MSKIQLDNNAIGKNIANIQAQLAASGAVASCVTSFDSYLNEYVPMSDCHRYYVTGFTGSVAEVLVPKEGRVKLYVDGRYHEHADNEVDPKLVEVVKVPASQGVWSTLVKDLGAYSGQQIGFEPTRFPISRFSALETDYKLTADDYTSVLNTAAAADLSEVTLEKTSVIGKTVSEKLNMIFKDEKSAHFVTALDSLAWISNCRGYHLPFQCVFLGKALATKSKLYIFVEPGMNIGSEAQNEASIEWVTCTSSDFESKLQAIQNKANLEKVYYQPAMLNTSNFQVLGNVFGASVLSESNLGLITYHSIKDDTEIKTMRENFLKGDKAIYNTVKWVRDSIANGDKVSEKDLYNKTTEFYKAEGAVEQSFNTISGCDSNGSIIHYGDPKDSVFIQKDSMVLLDSGGYLGGGFTTDTTRTFMGSADGTPTAKHKKMFTLVLKGTLSLQNAVFPEGTKGCVLDGIARNALWREGMDYAHGTGHGVGINVHESGVGISPRSDFPMKAGQVVSVEPGFYEPGFGGVRIENIAHVIAAPGKEGFLTFENLVYIGFDHALIDFDLLTAQEKNWLDEYESVCKKRGTSFL